MDSHIITYGVLSTALNQGIIEVVLNSSTNARIQKSYAGLVGALSKAPLKNWLQDENKKPLEYREAVSKFTESCAGYCAASYVIGLGDRHNDNIMVCDSGQIFHIDFAHFLGNTMKFAGCNRETAPFVMTHEYLNVIGGEESQNYVRFIQHACFCYQILRDNINVIEILFLTLLTAKIPELSSRGDVKYIRKALNWGKSDQKSTKIFINLIDASIKSRGTRINFFVHNLCHPK
eukprot:TRINITY_DN12331_c0_g1_i1.p1 TRINITY_DN12331_c0_g1~~TRINITY_DN12331_c0_g1_i1.p1  ORF type:complete len:261 (-),score=28.71 TRINITY_DN12331_c0_g1_i1:123-821(-)